MGQRTPGRVNLSVVIPTLDEERNLPSCLSSLQWVDDIVVVDSGSADRTVEIARSFGARVVPRRLTHWAEHFNWISANVSFEQEWVYHCDADEIVPDDLAAELRAVTAQADRAEVAFRLRFKTMFLGRWMRHASLYPTWVMRLYRPGRVRWEREVNPVCIVDGPEGRLRGHFHHYSFSNGFNAWFDKHNRYSWQEAREALKARERGWPPLASLVSRHATERRMALKDASFHLPLRPTLRFLYMYLLRRGFLDGRAGWIYCRLLAAYELMIDVKAEEISRRAEGLPL